MEEVDAETIAADGFDDSVVKIMVFEKQKYSERKEDDVGGDGVEEKFIKNA